MRHNEEQSKPTNLLLMKNSVTIQNKTKLINERAKLKIKIIQLRGEIARINKILMGGKRGEYGPKETRLSSQEIIQYIRNGHSTAEEISKAIGKDKMRIHRKLWNLANNNNSPVIVRSRGIYDVNDR